MSGIWDATAFGIEPDTGADVTDRIRLFVQEGLANGAHTFQFKPGRYDIADDKAIHDWEAFMVGQGNWDLNENTDQKNVLIHVDGVERIVLDFHGSSLIFHGLIQPFSFKGCKEVVLRNVFIDWAIPLFAQGEIVSVNSSGMDIQFESEYPVQSGVPIAAMLSYAPESPHPLLGKIDWFHVVESTELIAPQKLRVILKEQARSRMVEKDGRAAPVVGMHLLVRHLMNYKAAFLFYQCDRVVMDRVTIYAVPGMGVIGHGCGDVTMHRLRIARKPGSNRVMSVNADATHFIGCFGTIEFDDCLFEGMGDDATNVHGFYYSIRGISKDRELICRINTDIQSEYPEIPAVGDVIEFTRRTTLKPYKTLTVSGVEVFPSGEIVLSFNKDLPEGLEVWDLLANVSRMASLRFRNSIVRNNRARAILVQTRDVIISDNTFDHCTGTAIHVNCAEGWKESVCTDNVTVTRNQFLSCGLGAGAYKQASALVLMTESESSEGGVHRNFTFTDNFIYGNGVTGIDLSSLSGGLVRGNRFKAVSEAVRIHSETCEQIVVE
ncbi:right-handed parallel beta-helix repeat-containing protein [Cohnella abietis]|uniref:Alpha-1,3-galactosidase B n=1 Tax=Cohnella abietis TaxID=2507935 RepID=A0A3T1D0B1_9BACL|nr:right-handed parallel beta-helix repeat-containing protein [Cohnella abietis]BBI31508.1 alpha-1,3-galactosidase B [Cohnella abietis]